MAVTGEQITAGVQGALALWGAIQDARGKRPPVVTPAPAPAVYAATPSQPVPQPEPVVPSKPKGFKALPVLLLVVLAVVLAIVFLRR